MATDAHTADLVRQRLHRIQGGPSLGDRLVGGTMEALNLPGQYARGVLAGKPGAQMSQEELYRQGHPDAEKGFMARLVPEYAHPRLGDAVATDPLTYAGPSLMKAGVKGAKLLRAGAQTLGEGPAANPLVNAMRRFGAEEGGKLDWSVFGNSLPSLKAQEAFKQLGPDEFFKQGVGYGVEQTPAHQLDVLGERAGVPVHWASPDIFKNVFHDYTDPAKYNLAAYYSRAPGIYHKSIVLPTTQSIWWDPAQMRTRMIAEGAPRLTEQGLLPPWLSTANPRHLAVHELSHALHHRAIGDNPFHTLMNERIYPWSVQPIERDISRYGATSPTEAVAETAAKGIISPQGYMKAIPAPIRKQYTREWEGPNIGKMKKELGL